MPRVILSKELVKEITKMPVKEKDKLLMRLIRKDGLLAEQLEFQLIEFGETTEERRNMISNKIEDEVNGVEGSYLNQGIVLMRLRDYSGQITRHLKVTKDKIGEIELTLQLFNSYLDRAQGKLIRKSYYDLVTLGTYVVKRAEKLKKTYCRTARRLLPGIQKGLFTLD
ncbi:MAG: hypothetical protein IPL69_01315 [Saprospiraceae bacterium]|nr:hypothetical protein [Candidatus Brachybacter algidus]